MNAFKILEDIIIKNATSMKYHDSESIRVNECVLEYSRFDWVTSAQPAFHTEKIDISKIDPGFFYTKEQDGNWPFMIVGTRDGVNVEIYRNGALTGTKDGLFIEFQSDSQAFEGVEAIRTMAGECAAHKHSR